MEFQEGEGSLTFAGREVEVARGAAIAVLALEVGLAGTLPAVDLADTTPSAILRGTPGQWR